MNIPSNAVGRGRSAFLKAAKLVVPGAGALTLAAVAQAQPDYAPAHWNPINCAKYWTTGSAAGAYYGEGGPYGHLFCVIHDMEGYYYTGISYLQRCDTSSGGGFNVGTSVYYVAHSDYDTGEGAPVGDITQLVRESYYAWHAVCWNPFMFGTEHEGFASNPAWYTEGMYQASAGLQKHLCDNYGIPKDRNHVIAHGQKLVSGWCTWLAANYPSINCTCNSHTDPGQYWNWDHFMAIINGTVNNASVAGSSVPSVVQPGASFTATVTMNNNGGTSWSSGNSYSLGSQNPQDNTTWGFGRVGLPSSPVNPGQTATFTINATAPTTPGGYIFAWRMIQDGVEWFGDTFSTVVNVASSPQGTGTSLTSYSFDWQSNPTEFSGTWVTDGDCGYTHWHTYVDNTACVNFGRGLKWRADQTWLGRGHWRSDVQIPCSFDNVNAGYTLLYAGGGDTASRPFMNQCPLSGWYNLWDADVTDMNTGGWRINTADTSAGSGCNGNCGYKILGAAGMHMYGDRWFYINDWTCLGGYSGDVNANNTGRTESDMYLYPAVDTSHGNVFAYGSSKIPGHVITGDCNNSDTLNVNTDGNAAAYGAIPGCTYAFAWMYSPSGAGPKFLIGADDNSKAWVNGTLIDDNQTTCCGRDSFETGGIGMPSGWSRILLKVYNGGGPGFGTVSLRNGTDRRWNERSVNIFNLGGYWSYGIGYEQDAWYPFIDVANFYGGSDPQPNANFYGNDTTVTASGTASNNGSPVPFWKVMHFEWGYGLSGDTDYADVTASGTSWSHTATGVTGHRRFHFFAVSQSGRTSFQDSGRTGGSNWADGGPGNYMDVYIDNVAPVNPSFSSVSAASASQVSLAWAVPLDQGAGIAPGDTEAADESSNASGNYYRVGDVGVQVYRNGTVISSWTAGGEQTASLVDTGLSPNTSFTYTLEARDNNSEGRGAWHNATGPQGSTTVWTLSVPPAADSITADQTSPPAGSNVTWTAVSGFGPGQVQYYRYAWDTSPTHAWTDTETQWSSGTLTMVPASQGAWYLHVKGYNGADVGNGTFDYSVTTALPSASTTALVSSQNPSTETSNVTFTATVSAVPPATGTPTGEVIFLANTIPFSTNALVSGIASASTASLPAGTNDVAAQYGGDGSFLSSADIVQQVVQSLVACSQTNAIVSIADNQDGTFTLTFVGTPQAQYYVVASPDSTAPLSWAVQPGSTNTVTNATGLWSYTVTNSATQQFYRSAAVVPCP